MHVFPTFQLSLNVGKKQVMCRFWEQACSYLPHLMQLYARLFLFFIVLLMEPFHLRGFSIHERCLTVFFWKCSCEVGLIVEATVPCDINHFVVRFWQLFCSQFKTVVHKISVKAHSSQCLKQFHKMTFWKTALTGDFTDGNIMVVKLMDIVQGFF